MPKRLEKRERERERGRERGRGGEGEGNQTKFFSLSFAPVHLDQDLSLIS